MTSERIKAVGESTPPLSIGFDIAIAMCRRADVLGHPYPSPELRVWLANQITIAVNAARSSSPTPDGVIKERDGRLPDGPGLSHSVSSPSGSPAAAASIPGAEAGPDLEGMLYTAWHDGRSGKPQNDPDAGLTHYQIAVEIGDLAKGGTNITGTVLGALNRAYQRGLEYSSRKPPVLTEDVFQKLEAYRKSRVRFGATSDEATSARVEVYNLAERCRYALDCARDQRAEREDAQRPRPQAASPVTEGEAPASIVQPPSSQKSGVGETEGWRSMDSAPIWEEVEVKVGCMTFRAKYAIGASLTEDERVCDQWQATREGEHPPCWSEGACWSSNADHCASMQPEAWRPVSAPRPSQREG